MIFTDMQIIDDKLIIFILYKFSSKEVFNNYINKFIFYREIIT
jgi:hypothetical protein